MSNLILSISDIPYEYDKLLRDNSFRYLVLQPGVGNQPLECSLCTAPLPQIEFEAISYVWGKDIKNKRIICDGRRINITTNLHNVLQRLRLSDQPRKLWADGICINQDDIDEKGHQVAIMGQLYRSAKRVLIYVGPDKGGYGPQLCSLLDEVDQMIEEICKHIDMSWGSFPYPDENNPLLSDVRWKSVYHLFWEEWFERGWVVREAACAQIGQVIWGSSNFDWRKLTRAYWWLLRRASQTFSDAKLFSTRGFILHAEAYAKHNKAFINSLAVELPSKKTALLEDLRNAILLKVSDPRDRIYAFMELSSDDEYAFIMTPDYNLPYLDVYRNFAIDYTRFTAAPSILEYVVHPGGALNPSEASWIPLWNLARAEWGNGVHSVSHTMLTSRDDSICEPSFGGKTTLKCRGVVLDRVTYAKHILRDESTAQQIFSKIWNDIQVHTRRSPYGPTRLLDAFLNTLSLGHYEEDWESWMRSRAAFVANFTLKQRHSHSAALLPEDIEGADDVINIFIQTVSRRISDSEFIATEREYMGIAPGFAQVGDLCAIIFGCTTPCILRPTDSQGCYKFFGACHITGKQSHIGTDGSVRFEHYLGSKQSKDWVDWDVEEQDIYLV